MNFSDPCSLAAPGGEIWIKYSCDGQSKPIETTIDKGTTRKYTKFPTRTTRTYTEDPTWYTLNTRLDTRYYVKLIGLLWQQK